MIPLYVQILGQIMLTPFNVQILGYIMMITLH